MQTYNAEIVSAEMMKKLCQLAQDRVNGRQGLESICMYVSHSLTNCSCISTELETLPNVFIQQLPWLSAYTLICKVIEDFSSFLWTPWISENCLNMEKKIHFCLCFTLRITDQFSETLKIKNLLKICENQYFILVSLQLEF